MCAIRPRFQVPLRMSDLPLETQHQQVRLLQQVAHDDPGERINGQLRVVRKILNLIEDRLQETPEDDHQLFLLETHRAREQQLLKSLRLQNTDKRYHALEEWVNKKLATLDPENHSAEDPEQEAQKAQLEHEKKTWETMIQRVREKLKKKPGDPKLMRLLGEHQGRLLHLQEQLRQQEAGIEEEALVLEKAEQLKQESDVPVTERVRLEREMEVLAALCEKTKQRLFAKPELLHLKGLIAHHENRLKALQEQLNALPPEMQTPVPE